MNSQEIRRQIRLLSEAVTRLEGDDQGDWFCGCCGEIDPPHVYNHAKRCHHEFTYNKGEVMADLKEAVEYLKASDPRAPGRVI